MLRCELQAFVVCVISEPQCCRCRSTRFAGRFGAARGLKTSGQQRRPGHAKWARNINKHQQTPRNGKQAARENGSAHAFAKAAKEVRALATSDIFDLCSRG